MRECRIGGLSWWAGVWWLVLSHAAHAAAWGALGVRDGATAVCWWLLGCSGRWARLAERCAREGGAE